MKTRIKYSFILVIIHAAFLMGSSIDKGFNALSIYDYFKAKRIFYSELKRNKAYAAYGLATIYSRNDNPFFNLDSASKFINLSFNSFRSKPIASEKFGFKIDSASILKLCDTIGSKAYRSIRNINLIDEINAFLSTNYLSSATIISKAIFHRDEIEFQINKTINSSKATTDFITQHPESPFLEEALNLLDHQIFNEMTALDLPHQYILFIKKYPKSSLLNQAYQQLYEIYRKSQDINGLKDFVHDYPTAPQVNEAWKLLFSLTVKSFSESELTKFLDQHPKFPFRNSIIKELELNKIKLFKYQMNDLFGFVDTAGKIIIPAEFDEAGEFSEGLSSVNKNDSAYFINKASENTFHAYFKETYPFKNGLAVVKTEKGFEFINRQGQYTGKIYNEIMELSDNMYVIVKNNKYGAVDQFGETIIEPRFDKLGDFKNGFAYYIDNSKYGFISSNGSQHRAEFDWISDFNKEKIAIFKQNGSYGLVNSLGDKIIEPQFDQIIQALPDIFLVIKNNLYGFYDIKGCYIQQPQFEFVKEKTPDYYTDGKLFKLIKNGEQYICDLNGRLLLEHPAYEEISFIKDGLMRVKRKGKFGYLDNKFSLSIPIQYEEATDFIDSLAIVKIKGKHSIINTKGKEVLTSDKSIHRLSDHYYQIGEEELDIFNLKGQKIFSGVKNIQQPVKGLLIITLNNNEIKLLRD